MSEQRRAALDLVLWHSWRVERTFLDGKALHGLQVDLEDVKEEKKQVGIQNWGDSKYGYEKNVIIIWVIMSEKCFPVWAG